MNKIVSKYKSLPVQIRASLWFLICSFLQKGISMITTPIFTRIMNTDEYGKFGVFNSWMEIIAIFVSLRLYYGVHSQGIVKFSEDREKFTSALQGLSTTLAALWTAAYLLFTDFWNQLFSLNTVQMMSMLIMIWTGAIFNYWANSQRVDYKYKSLVIVTLFVSFMKPLLEIILILNSDDKVTARILGMVIVELVAYSWFFFIQQKKGKVFYSKFYWKYALAFNLPLVPHYLSQTVLNSADRIMIERIVGESEAGIYNLAYSLSLIMTLFNTALSQTLSPWIYKKIKDGKNKDIAPMAYITLIIIAAVNLFLILLAPEALVIFAPKSYHEALYVIPPVAMSVFFMYAYDLFAKFAFFYEKTAVVMIASILGAVLNIILNYIFIQLFGYIAAGYTTFVCYIVYTVVHYVFMCKVCHKCSNEKNPYDTKIIIMIAVPFILTGFAFLATYHLPIVRYGIVIVILILVIVYRKNILGVVKDLRNLRRNKE